MIMELDIKGKTALVTGSTAGIGLAIAHGLAQEGVQVIINGRSSDRVVQAQQQIANEAPQTKTFGIAADLSTAAGAQAVIDQFEAVDILVNNLGLYGAKPFSELQDADWLAIFETNVMSGVRLSRHYLPKMMRKNWGRIVFISSESGLHIPEEMIHYGVTKTAQIALARGLAETTRGTHVTVNSVLPGPTLSEGVRAFIENLAQEKNISKQEFEDQFFRQMRPSSLIQRFATPREVGHLVVYLCSALSSATNGAALRVDGGVVRAIP
jgi:NAD(P)-dependent dehydrogenase (short-subunit alcohol dehydrogenase family)